MVCQRWAAGESSPLLPPHLPYLAAVSREFSGPASRLQARTRTKCEKAGLIFQWKIVNDPGK
jgi:hypothetical protein